MTNAEFFKKEIFDIVYDGYGIGIDRVTNKPEACELLDCNNCSLAGRCSEGLREWCHSEYIDKSKLTKNEKKFLDILNRDFKYLARNKDGKIYAFSSEKPQKDDLIDVWHGMHAHRIDLEMFNILFFMIKWEDEDPWLIDDLRKLEVYE